MDEKPKRLTSAGLVEFLRSLGITREEPVGRSSDSGEQADDARLSLLLEKGDPVSPGPGRVSEDPATLNRLFAETGESACFGLTPDGHLTSHQPLRFDPDAAAEQVVRLMEVEMAGEDREEALAASWLGLAYHDHDHPADFGGLVRDGSDGQPKCCYLDVKGTRALSPAAQRIKLEQRAQERKFGFLAQTLTRAANNGFARYPGRGKPGLLVTLLHNPVRPEKTHSGFAMGWFFGIRSNYQATAAVWGWGGALGVKLPNALQGQLASSQTTIRGQARNLLELLGEYRDYGQFRDAGGVWDRESLRSTLLAMSLAARYLLMQEDAVAHAEQAAENLTPKGVDLPLSPEEFHPGESFASYYGRRADAAIRDLRQAEDTRRQAEEARHQAEDARHQAEDARRQAEDARRQAEEKLRRMVARRRQKGDGNAAIAEDLGCTVQELLESYPEQT